MEDQPILENASSEFMTLSYADQALASHPEQIPNESTNMSKYLNILYYTY